MEKQKMENWKWTCKNVPIAGAKYCTRLVFSVQAALLYVRKVGIASLVMSIRMFSSRTNELCALSLLLYCALDYSAYD